MGYDGQPANGSSEMLQISGNGRYVVFASSASNLVADDGEGQMDVFRFDRKTQKTELVSVGETETDGGAGWPSISSDGRYVAYQSPGTGSRYRAIVRDMDTGAVIFEGVDFTGPPALSGDGRYLATLRNDEPGATFPKGTILLYDLSTGDVAWSVSIDRNADPLFIGQEFRLSQDGRWFAFLAGQVDGGECEERTTSISINNVTTDVPLRRPFVHDLQTGATWCTPLDDQAGVSIQTGPISISGDTLIYGTARWETESRRMLASEIALVDMDSGAVRLVSKPGEPFYGTDSAPGAGDGGRALAVVNSPGKPAERGVFGILWTVSGGEREIVQTPARFEDWGVRHAEPALSSDGRSLAFGVRGQDRTSGSQVQDIYVVSR